ncbi:hypothetical protein HYY69_02610 [Candidatus Woesearchaeota archaeon]|nr:hypothetical protein [Candidatus Woesearchaeota archaeon]
MMSGCAKCCKLGAVLVVVLGVLFLLVDLGKWDFWGINWWTALFLVCGVVCFGKSCCKECQSCK